MFNKLLNPLCCILLVYFHILTVYCKLNWFFLLVVFFLKLK
uniref:Uncharacterized protein n=1 Tax=Anguilla anguilla TaxID=7936 RepID=A0A0E9XXK8_ANGAN